MAEDFNKFFEKRGYAKGTYENLLTGQGYNLQEIGSQYDYGENVNPNEYQTIISRFQSPYQQKLGELAGDKFAWNPADYLPEIQQTAESIYGPQKAQLEVLRQLSAAQAEQAKIETEEQFATRMQQEVESINRRGAYFSGGAIRNEQQIRTEQARTIAMQTMQAQAEQFSLIAQQAGLSAQQAQFIKESLFSEKSSAYNLWKDNRDFQFNVANQQQGNAWQAATTGLSASQWNTDYNLDFMKYKNSVDNSSKEE